MAGIDPKLLYKQFLTDPTGIYVPRMPSDAMIKGVAKGNEGNRTGVYGYSERSTAIYGESPIFAGFFAGDVNITGNLSVDGDTQLTSATVTKDLHVFGDVYVGHADIAEDFDLAEGQDADPGTVMSFDPTGKLFESLTAYDKHVAGVLSGAASYRPGLILDRKAPDPGRKPVALMGKVYCKVDADCGAIEVGDPLTTSPTPGHAMKAVDPLRAFGAVLGKALKPLASGKALLPILVALQ